MTEQIMGGSNSKWCWKKRLF